DGPLADDPTMDLALLPTDVASLEGIEAVRERAVLIFSDDPRSVAPGGSLEPGEVLHQLRLESHGEKRFRIDIPIDGTYALFTQHGPEEFAMRAEHEGTRVSPAAVRVYNPEHEHDDEVTSVGITADGELDKKRLNAWLSRLLMEKGNDIYRMKGVLAIRGEARRFVFQGVHMLFDGQPDKPWGSTPRRSQLVFIGKNLDREDLTKDFLACLAR
ncbi:MAG: GTP-binding protein, partial [Armatimonadetes bacterium]|nr:GTP-binding protein [Armatimonadota bacterium]